MRNLTNSVSRHDHGHRRRQVLVVMAWALLLSVVVFAPADVAVAEPDTSAEQSDDDATSEVEAAIAGDETAIAEDETADGTSNGDAEVATSAPTTAASPTATMVEETPEAAPPSTTATTTAAVSTTTALATELTTPPTTIEEIPRTTAAAPTTTPAPTTSAPTTPVSPPTTEDEPPTEVAPRSAPATADAVLTPMAVATNTFHEIVPGWADDTPTTVPYGDVVVSEFRVNTNDASEPPQNNDALNVTVTLTAAGGVFDSLPVICDTTGVTPVSSISPDGVTMVCNMGTIVEGNSTIVRAPIRATDLDGGPLQVTGTVDSDTSPAGPVGPESNDPLPITYTNGMDLQLEEAPGQGIQGREITSGIDGAQRREIVMNFSLSLLDGSTPGPATYSFPFTAVRTDGGGPTSVRFEEGIDGTNDCVPVGTQTRALGHPYSDPALPDRTNFPTCTITGSGTNYTLTVSGLDYSFATVPTNDSFGTPLPNDRTYIASASVRFSVPATVGGASYEFSAPNAPNFTFARGAPPSYVDDKANNTGSLTITAPGGFSNAWYGTLAAGRNRWDDNLWLNQGAGTTTQSDIYHQANNRYWESYTGPGGLIAGTCTMHSSTSFVADYVDFGAWTTGVGHNTDPIDSARLWYTTDPIDTRTHTCGTGNWTEIPVPDGYLAGNPNTGGAIFPVPANTTGVRVMWDPTESYEGYLFLRMFGSISPNAPLGSEIWTSSAYTHPNHPGVWANRSDDPSVRNLRATPWSNYVQNHPGTNGYRDVLRIQGYAGVITKEAQSGAAVPGQPVTYELTAEAQTTTLNPQPTTITVVDELPVGLEYVPGTATPAPTSVTGDATTGMVLTFTIPNAAANTEYPISYQAQIPPDTALAPDTRLTNVATITVPGDSRLEAARQARDTITVPSEAATQFLKTTVDPQLNFYGDTASWTLTINSFDREPSAFTDLIDVLPYAGDARGTNPSGVPPYTITTVDAPTGATVYYTTVDPATIIQDPRDPSNGTYPATGSPSVSAMWSTTAPADMNDVTGIRVITPDLAPGGAHTTTINFTTPPGTECLTPVAGENRPDENLVNSATAIAEETALRMLSSAQTTIGGCVDFQKDFTDLERLADGTYDLTYRLTAEGVGQVLPYDLVDVLHYGDAITVNGQPTATFVPRDPAQTPVPVLNTWDPATSTLTVAQDVPIADGEVQVFDVAVNVSVDGGDVTFENTNCAIDGNETDDTGLRNIATLTNPDVTIPDEACPEVPYVTHEKALSAGPTPNGDGTYTVEYTIDVTNTGAGDDVYDLSDEFMFGEAITIEGTPTVVNTVPGDIATLGTWDPATTTLAIVDDEPIGGSEAAGPTTHTYVVSVDVSVDAETVTFAGTDCDLGADESGTGLLNETSLTVDAHVTNDDDCAPISEPLHTKTVSAGPTGIGGGLYEVEYTIEVTNAGAADSVYDLVDDFQFGEAVTVEGTPTVTNTVPGGIATLGTWDPATTTLAIVDDEPIVAGAPTAAEVHEYVVTVQVSVDAPTVTFENTDCTLGEGESGTGLFNTARMSVNGEETDRDACPPISEPAHTKTISAGPTRLDNGNYAVEFTVEVVNAGGAASVYDLVDDFEFSNAVTIEGTPTVANSEPGGIATLGTWDPDATTLAIVDDEPIAAGAAGTPTVHRYVVALEVSVDPAQVTLENSDCELGNDAGTGLFNTATMTVNDEQTDADTCTPFPEPDTAFDKSLVSATPNGDGTYTITYTLTVDRTGVGVPYDLTDTLRYGEGTTVNSTTITGTTPDGLPINNGWNGADDNVVAADVPIADGDTHVYEVTVNASIDEPAVPEGASDCDMGGDDGTGFSNTATLTTGDEVFEDDGCAPFPVITLDKEIAPGPTDAGNGQHAVTYTISVTNSGEGDGVYDLTDTLTYGVDITITDATVANALPGGIATNSGWDGENDIDVVTDEPIAAATDGGPTVHTYEVTVVAEVPEDLPVEGGDCTLQPGEPGTGFLNVATMSVNGETSTDDACGEVSERELEIVKTVGVTSADYDDTVDYTVTVENTGAVDFTEDSPAVVVDDLADVLDDAGWVGDAEASVGSVSYSEPELTWTGPLAVGDTATISYTVTVTGTGTGNGDLYNAVSSNTGDNNCSDGSSDPNCETNTPIPPPTEPPAPTAPPSPVTPSPIPVTG